ncbi:efflux RND transporter periplasmic adaptor subunit [Lutimonas halocynthiae]|uniref:efflux RND transporter periplasmic adaptor subunit n=1 Tax=Lutimonas halocynthiae TaxID=1446477 RepID=UPI0025B34A5B|nr:efflux RND transporter periplasmic adaptor subunit [Lutimonas halocynthiae]MDN3644530.1 efflux RND transporter periplasmic adaptor subunit [Lutimonas halocynthiae]
MKKVYFLLLLSAIIFSCKKGDKQQAMPPQPFEVYEIQTKSVPIYEEFVGQIYGEKDIPIRARVEGFLEGIHFDEGERVEKGQLLYSIDPDPFQEKVVAEESKVSEAQTVLVQAESDLRRIEPLAAMDAVSQQELDMAVSKRDAAISSLEAAKANLNIAKINKGYCKMYAPIEGIIGKTNAREGEFVGKDPNPVILNTVSQLRAIRVQFFLTEPDYLKIARAYLTDEEMEMRRVEGDDRAELELILADGTLYDQKGEVDFIDRNIDSSTGSILVQASFPNPQRLIRPGQFARVRIRVREDENSIVIPQKCAKELQGQFSVMFVNNENVLESKTVEVTDKVGEFYIIKEGLNNGDKIILEGIQKARSGMEIIPQVTEFVSQQTPQS